jgi:hypothetical protein
MKSHWQDKPDSHHKPWIDRLPFNYLTIVAGAWIDSADCSFTAELRIQT